MNVRTLKQYLLSLVPPLTESRASREAISSLEAMADALGPFENKPIHEFSEFLVRSQDYEREGHWPKFNPPISGQVVDRPTSNELAIRLEAFLRRAVPSTGAMPESVEIELNHLKAVTKLPQLKEVAKVCGVPGSFKNANATIERVFEHITGRKLTDAILDTCLELLVRANNDNSQLGEALKKIESSCNATQIKRFAKELGINEKIQSKPDGIAKLRSHLSGSSKVSLGGNSSSSTISDVKISRIVETLHALKEKAHPQDAPEAEILEELSGLESQMNKDEAIVAAARFGVRRTVSSKADAMKRISDEVFESKIMRDKVRH